MSESLTAMSIDELEAALVDADPCTTEDIAAELEARYN